MTNTALNSNTCNVLKSNVPCTEKDPSGAKVNDQLAGLSRLESKRAGVFLCCKTTSTTKSDTERRDTVVRASIEYAKSRTSSAIGLSMEVGVTLQCLHHQLTSIRMPLIHVPPYRRSKFSKGSSEKATG
eukprot:m.51307 g.51307  ORF g.51307 m.51307 type:complete len:129 (+) comp13447_c0_seq35:4242-4628(+)